MLGMSERASERRSVRRRRVRLRKEDFLTTESGSGTVATARGPAAAITWSRFFPPIDQETAHEFDILDERRLARARIEAAL